MNAETYLVAAYIISIGLLWGYATALWIEARTLRGRERRFGATAPSSLGPRGGNP
jgi:hypothetical protein